MALPPEERPKLPLPQVREALGFSVCVHGITSYPDPGGREEKEEGRREGGREEGKRKKEKHKKKDGSDYCEEGVMRQK